MTGIALPTMTQSMIDGLQNTPNQFNNYPTGKPTTIQELVDALRLTQAFSSSLFDGDDVLKAFERDGITWKYTN